LRNNNESNSVVRFSWSVKCLSKFSTRHTISFKKIKSKLNFLYPMLFSVVHTMNKAINTLCPKYFTELAVSGLKQSVLFPWGTFKKLTLVLIIIFNNFPKYKMLSHYFILYTIYVLLQLIKNDFRSCDLPGIISTTAFAIKVRNRFLRIFSEINTNKP